MCVPRGPPLLLSPAAAPCPHPDRRPGWDLRCVIVKTGDDCRQELLAMQLIRAFHEIFGEARLPLWLRPYEVGGGPERVRGSVNNLGGNVSSRLIPPRL